MITVDGEQAGSRSSGTTDGRTAAEVAVRVFGALSVEHGDDVRPAGGPRIRRLLALLVLRPGRTSTVDELIEQVWDDDDRPGDPESALRTYVSRLRRELPEELRDAVETVSGGYRWAGPPERVEHVRFERLRADATSMREAGDPGRALGLLDEALAHWRGRPFRDLADVASARAVIEGLEVDRLEAEEERFEVELALGRHTQVVGRLTAFTAEHATRDRAAGQLALALYRSGRTSDAIRALHDHRRRLRDETGLDPSPPLVELERRLLDGDPDLDPPVSGVPLRGYRLLDCIGTGTFSVVWRAIQPSVGREVAVKQIRAELATQPDFVRRFEAEAHLVARIEHPHVVPLIDYWRDPDSAYFVMRWLRGGSLEERLRGGPLPLKVARRVIDEIGGALVAAHGRGVLHRDVKTANILFDEDGVAYLTDFGIAVDTTTPDPDVSALSTGSPAFASPEQQAREPLDVRADVYSLGVVAAEALLGGPSGRGPRPVESLRRRDDLPAVVVEAIARAVSPDRSDRFPTVRAFLDALHAEARDRTPRPPGPNPYRGLRPFEEADAQRFFGRDRLVDELAELVERRGVVVLVGPSGSGKSSVVRAGLLPRLRTGRVAGADRWFVATMTPGTDPFAALATALDAVATRRDEHLVDVLRSGDEGIVAARTACGIDPDQTVLVVVDQLEELHTTADPADAEAFLAALATAASTPDAGIRVVATLRADQYHGPLVHPTFAEHLKQGAVDVTPLRPDELEQAVVDPATDAGVDFEPGLVARIVADAHGHAAVLPLLQHLLRELYERRVGSRIPASAYGDLGGVGGALAATAERLYRDAEADEQRAIRSVFGALVAPATRDDLRRRVRLADVQIDEAAAAVVDRYAAARLLTLDRDRVSREPTVEVTHEALLRSWPRLAGWLAEDRELLSHVGTLQAAADRWDGGGRSPADLLRGVRLEAGTELAHEAPQRLRPVDVELVGASAAADEAERAVETRRSTRLRRLVTATAFALVAALVAASLALDQRNRADDEAAAARAEAGRAEAAADAADVQTLISRSAALADDDTVLSILLALEAQRRAPSRDTEGAVLASLVAGGALVSAHEPLVGPGERCDTDGRVSADGRFQYPTLDGRMVVHEIRTGTQRDVGPHPEGCGWWEPSTDGERFMTLSRSQGRLRFGRLGPTGPEVATELTVPPEARGTRYEYVEEATGRRMWLPIRDGAAVTGRLIDTLSGALVGDPIEGLVNSRVAFSPDGSLLAVSSGTGEQPDGGGPLHLLDAETGTIRWTVELPVRAKAFAYDLEAGHLIVGTLTGQVVTLALADGRTLSDVSAGGSTDLLSLSLRTDGLVVATSQGSLALVDRFNGARGAPLSLPSAFHGTVAPDGTVTVHTTDEGKLVYDLNGGAVVEQAFPIPLQTRVRYSDGYLTALDIAAGTVDRVEVETGERDTFELLGPDGERVLPTAVAPQADGSFTTISADLDVALWDSGGLVASAAPELAPGDTFEAGGGYTGHVAVSALGADGTSTIHRFQVDDDVRHVTEIPLEVRAAGVFPTGAAGVHVITDERDFRTYDDQGELVRRLDVGCGCGMRWVDGDPEGRRLVFGGPGGLVVIDQEDRGGRRIEEAGDVANVSLTQDGARAVVGTRDGVYRLWDLEERRAIAVLYRGSSASLGPPGIEEDGRHAWLSTPGRAIRVPIDPEAWIERACEVVGRELTGAEWAEHVPGDVAREPACASA
ncbi:MAG: BTAD domain-containing putative transcriptional regulator [Nitriliruptoraceae bacterium]